MTMTRRFLAAAAAATAIALSAAGPAAAQKVKIGVIYPSPIGEVGWAHELDVGRQAIAERARRQGRIHQGREHSRRA